MYRGKVKRVRSFLKQITLALNFPPLPSSLPQRPPSMTSRKDTECREVLDAATLEVGVLVAVEVEVEPVGELDLEEDSDEVVPLTLWDVDDESTGTTQNIMYIVMNL